MSLDLTRLREPIAPSDQPELDASDDRLVVIDALAARDRFEEAADKVSDLLAEGIFDIRPIPYYLYQAFVEDGFRGLASVLEVIENLLGPSFAAIAPSRRREELFDKRLRWLFDKTQSALEYHDKRKTELWRSWEKTLTVETVDQTLAAGARVAELMAAAVYSTSATALGQLLSVLRNHARALRAAETAETADATAPPQPASPGAGSAPAASSPGHDAHAADGLSRMQLVVSYAFVELCKKLQAFEVLVQRQRFDKAAVLAEEIAQSVSAFDPRTHFPELFARYVALQSKHVGPLTQHSNDTSSPAWRALQQYCRVDLKGFVEGDP